MRTVLIALSLVACLSLPLHAETYSIVICHTNDVHGGIDSSQADFMNPEFPPQLGGGASAATLINRLREYCREQGKGFLLIDTGDIFQGTLVGTKTEGEADGLDDRHQREYDSDRTRRLGTQLADENGIGDIIEGSHQHGDDGGDGQLSDQP